MASPTTSRVRRGPCFALAAGVPTRGVATRGRLTRSARTPWAAPRLAPRPCQGTRQRGATMQLPPASHFEPPLSEEQRGPPDYKWDPAYPGTMKPGSVDDNYPLQRVLDSDVYEVMQYEELDIDDRTPRVFIPGEDMLHWLSNQGRLMPKDISDQDFELEAEKQMSAITEEDLEYGDDDTKMIAYYSKQGQGSAAGSGADFGGFADSSGDGPGM